jgi:exopolysaccharide production protein ExoQ
MPSEIATFVCALVVVILFWLDRRPKVPTSRALWLPLVWLWLAGTRSVSQWLSMDPIIDSPDQVLEGSPLDRLVYAGLLTVGIAVLAQRRTQVGKLLRANGPIVWFFVYCALSILWSEYPEVALKRWTKAVGDFVMVLVVLSDHEPFTAMKRLLARLTYLLIPLSVLFIKYYPNLGRLYGRWDGKTYYIGVTLDKNGLGVLCLFFGLASAWRLLAAYHERRGRDRSRHLLAHGVILAMVLWLFWIANSMTSLSCFILGSIVLVAASLPKVVRRPAVLHLLVAAMLATSVSVLFLDLGPGVLATMGRDPTLTDRTKVWAVLVSLVDNPLLGTGFASFWLGARLEKIWSVYWWHPEEAHNGYLEVFLNLGWSGVALLAFVIATGYRTVTAAYRRNLLLGSLGVAYFVAGVVYNLTEAGFFRMMAPAWILFLLAITRVSEPSERRSKVTINPALTPLANKI